MYNKSIKKMIDQQNKLKKLYEKPKWITQYEDMINQISGVTSFINQQQDAFNQTKKLAGLLNTNAFDFGLKIEPIPGVTSFINQQQDAFNMVNRTNKIAGLLNTNAFNLGLKLEPIPGLTSFVSQQKNAYNMVNQTKKLAGLLNTNAFDFGFKFEPMPGIASFIDQQQKFIDKINNLKIDSIFSIGNYYDELELEYELIVENIDEEYKEYNTLDWIKAFIDTSKSYYINEFAKLLKVEGLEYEVWIKILEYAVKDSILSIFAYTLEVIIVLHELKSTDNKIIIIICLSKLLADLSNIHKDIKEKFEEEVEKVLEEKNN